MQWREPHDPTFSGLQEDHYRVPLADLHLTVLQQRDPSGKRLPADDLQVVARSQGLPLRLASSPTSATYEQTVEFTVDQPGRYALRGRGKDPRGIRPADVATLPSLATLWEVQPRISVNMLDPQVRAQGRPIFLDYSTNLGSLGMPADAHQVVSVGAADPSGQPAADCTGGPALGQALHAKPDVLSPGALDLGAGGVNATAGSGIATAFAAGVAADALSARVPVNYLLQSVFGNPGKICARLHRGQFQPSKFHANAGVALRPPVLHPASYGARLAWRAEPRKEPGEGRTENTCQNRVAYHHPQFLSSPSSGQPMSPMGVC